MSDGASLSRESTFAELKRYVRFDGDDLARLRAFHPGAAPHFPRISAEFYERIREHQDANEVFTGEAQIARLRRSLVRWLDRICTGDRDEDYFEETAKIGRAHVRVGLPQRYVLTAMALIRISLDRIADETMGAAAPQVRQSLAKALDVELAVMLETYHDDFVARLRRVERLAREDLGRALARSEHRYAHAVELAPYLVIGFDERGEILLFNREAERISGHARDEVLGRPWLEVLVPEEAREEVGKRVEAAIAGIDGGTFDALLRTRSGNHRKIRWNLAHAGTAVEGDVVAIATGRDRTDEEAREVRARQIEKLAAVGTLAAGLAHEIRNPLNGAQLHLTFLERGLRRQDDDPEALEAVRVVGSEIQRLSNLVNEFLDFARPKPLDRRRTEIQALCRHVAGLVAGAAGRHRVDLGLDLSEVELVAEIDPGRIEQVLLNLLHNAIEAAGEHARNEARGRVALRVRRAPLHFVLEVEDDGGGLPDEAAPIFDAFYTTKPTGTGLGLAIVHRIVTDHGGSISHESRPGCTIFRVTIPLAAPPKAEREPRRERP
jgi:PAS domain S-box-containing protein